MDDDEIVQRLIGVEEILLDSVTDRDTLLTFDQRWSNLQADIERARANNQLKTSTVDMIRASTGRVAIIANTVIDMISVSDQLGESMLKEASLILGRAGFSESQHISSSSESPCAPSTLRDFATDAPTSLSPDNKQHPCPTYIASAYKWLRHNLHKPYPTVEEVKSICANSNTSEKRIRNWFISARQRMGWTRIAKEHFHSDREDTADAAYRALVETDPKRPIDAKLMFEFVKMELAAEKMYSTAFQPSQFAGSLGTTIVGMSAEHKGRIEQMRQQVIEEENLREEVEYKMKKQRIAQRRSSQRRSVSLYPSPDRSSDSSPEPTLVLSETEEDETDVSLSNTAAGRKRGHLSSSPDQLDSHVDKRPRFAVCPYRCTLDFLRCFLTGVLPPRLCWRIRRLFYHPHQQAPKKMCSTTGHHRERPSLIPNHCPSLPHLLAAESVVYQIQMLKRCPNVCVVSPLALIYRSHLTCCQHQNVKSGTWPTSSSILTFPALRRLSH
jgi:hypothetical protein